MQNENDDNVDKINQRDTKRYEAQDNDGHTLGTHKAGNTQEKMEEVRKAEANDDSELNKLDARGTVGGNETA